MHAGCVFCRHSPVQDMKVRIFGVRVMECTCAQTRPRFILSSEGVFRGMKSETMLTPRGKSPLPGAQRRIEPATLQHAGQRARHTIDWAIPPLPSPPPPNTHTLSLSLSLSRNSNCYTLLRSKSSVKMERLQKQWFFSLLWFECFVRQSNDAGCWTRPHSCQRHHSLAF